MYGMLLESIQHFLREMYGEDTWTKIRTSAGVENHIFITHQRYSDNLFLKLAEGASEVIAKDHGQQLGIRDFMKAFGTFFVKFFSNYGYDQIIRVTGRNFTTFLNSIDTIHEHMRFGYPKMESPSFYCDDETSTGLTLHYVSKRFGFKFYVIGQIEQIAKEFYSIDIHTEIIAEQLTSKRSHIIYRLQFNNEASKPSCPEKILGRADNRKQMRLATFFDIFPFSFVISQDMKISMAGSCLTSTLGENVLGKSVHDVFSLRRPKTEFTWEQLQTKRVIFELISKIPTKTDKTHNEDIHSKANYLNRLGCLSNCVDVTPSDLCHELQSRNSLSPKCPFSSNGVSITPSDLCHERQSRNFLSVNQRDIIIPRDSKQLKHNHKNGFSKLTKNDLDFLMNNNNYHCHDSKKGVATKNDLDCPLKFETRSNESSGSFEGINFLHLKGEMKFVSSWQKVLFVCSPVISGLDEMISLGLYMSDLGIYDRSQEMLLSGITPLPQLEYTRDQLIEKSKRLEENLKELEDERKRSNELLYLMMPKPIAERLKNGAAAIDTCEYFENVTILFSYLDGFIKLCSNLDAMEIVTLVDRMFTVFDCLSEKHDVYKFETLGDAVYMAVSGAPVRKMRHAEPMAAMAIDMIESMDKFKLDSHQKTLTITIGMHSGAVAAGLVGQKTPQYCLFGDTVNIASRLRTTSLPMRINMSGSCNDCLKGSEYIAEFRGKIPLKGLKQEMDTYWLIGRKSNTK